MTTNNINYYTQQIHQRGFRITPQRLVILQILIDEGDHLSPIEIYQRAAQIMPGMTEATVYRTLSFLAEQGIIMSAHIGSGQLVYEISEYKHHHLICRSCKKTIDIDHEMLKDLYQKLEDQTGFKLDIVHLTFFGLCPECQKKFNSPIIKEKEV
jgi:Fe2+ or Zn2+ uptake regulation protein